MSVMPRKVQLRVAALIAAGALLSAAPWLVLPAGAAALLQAALVLCGLAIGWCLWPRWTWFIAPAQRGELPRVPGQGFRLSFDDGPTPGLTAAVLDILARHRVRASFFVLVHKARREPDLVRRIVREGHVLGLHGEDHRLPFFRPADELAASLGRARAELSALAGVPIDLYRPSHGWKTPALCRAVRRAGLRFCMWDHGVWDTDAPPAEVLAARLLTVAPPGASGDEVVLLHDGRDDDPRPPPHAAALAEALALWLAVARPVAE